MDFVKEVIEKFSLFLNEVMKSEDGKDFDLWTVLTDLKVSREESDDNLLPKLETLISQLQMIKEKFIKKSPAEMVEVNALNDTVAMETDEILPGARDTFGQKDSVDEHCDDKNKRTLEVNPNIVQIKASRNEIERRIASFIEKKQREVNQLNNREFCSGFSLSSDGVDAECSCARTDAVFVPRAGSKSHIKISRVVNTFGPQTKREQDVASMSTDERSRHSETTGVEERIKNIEDHLKVQLAGTSKIDLYNRLKTLEDRILYLEGLSPEYFQNVPPPKRQKVCETNQGRNIIQDLSLQEVEDKIQSLQASLQMKSSTSGWGDS